MLEVAIVGAGELGGTLAHVLARRDVASVVRLVDPVGQTASGKALDIMQASPIDRFATRVVGSTDLSVAAGASIVLVADRMGAGEWNGADGFLLLKQLVSLTRRAVVVCAGASQRELVERGVLELGYKRERLIGSAPEALASAVRALVALETDGSAREVALTVLGVPPAHVVIPWEDATVGGFPITRVLDEPTRRRLSARVAPLWPPGPYALANSATECVAAIAGRSKRTLSCFVAGGEVGRRSRVAALPLRLGRNGVVGVAALPLSGSARVALENAREI